MMPRPTSPPTTPPAIAPALDFLDVAAELPPMPVAVEKLGEVPIETVEAAVVNTVPVGLEPIPVDSGAADEEK